jgi:hypothetical protein
MPFTCLSSVLHLLSSVLHLLSSVLHLPVICPSSTVICPSSASQLPFIYLSSVLHLPVICPSSTVICPSSTVICPSSACHLSIIYPLSICNVYLFYLSSTFHICHYSPSTSHLFIIYLPPMHCLPVISPHLLVVCPSPVYHLSCIDLSSIYLAKNSLHETILPSLQCWPGKCGAHRVDSTTMK